jgi:hypothetical protein
MFEISPRLAALAPWRCGMGCAGMITAEPFCPKWKLCISGQNEQKHGKNIEFHVPFLPKKEICHQPTICLANRARRGECPPR